LSWRPSTLPGWKPMIGTARWWRGCVKALRPPRHVHTSACWIDIEPCQNIISTMPCICAGPQQCASRAPSSKSRKPFKTGMAPATFNATILEPWRHARRTIVFRSAKRNRDLIWWI